MSHENSITVKRKFPKLGTRFVNVGTSGKSKGKTLGPRKGFNTVKAAVSAAQKRSQSGRRGKKQPRTR